MGHPYASYYHACLSQFGSAITVSRISDPSRPLLTLHKRREHFTPRLQQWMPNHNLQESLEPLPTMLNHVVGEAVRQDLAWQRWYSDARALALQYVAEGFEVAVAPAHGGGFELEGGDVGAHYDFVGGVHAAADACSSISITSM